MKNYEEINIGDTAEIKHTIIQTDIEKFVDLTGDDNKLHVDEDYASTTSFKKPVAHGDARCFLYFNYYWHKTSR